MSEPFIKLPPIEGGNKGCLCCGRMHQALDMESIIGVGFGSAGVTKDGHGIWQEEHGVETLWQVKDAEEAALKDPDHDWRIYYIAPLYEAEYQRQGDGHWVLISKGIGFA